MPLSEYEQRVLEQMERQLSSDDPRLANTLAQKRHRSVNRYAIAAVGGLVGLLLLVIGAASATAWLGVVGFVLMFAAVTFAVAMPAPKAPAADGARPAEAKRPAPRRRSLMSRFEDRWDRRRDQGGR
jgi:hypothetical protein